MIRNLFFFFFAYILGHSIYNIFLFENEIKDLVISNLYLRLNRNK